MLKLIALTTLVVFPILLLLLLQIQFLPFHDVNVTNTQRDALFLDLLLLWLLRPPILADLSVESSGHARLFPRALRAFGLALAGVMSIAALWFSFVVATIPGEWQETASPRWIGRDGRLLIELARTKYQAGFDSRSLLRG